MKPNKTNLRKWVAALRSGNYTQSKGTLEGITRGSDGLVARTHCCLGVATRVYMAENPEIIKTVELEGRSTDFISPMQNEIYEGETYSEYSVLPHVVADWLGLDNERNPEFVLNDGSKEPATTVNDSIGLDFNQIADAIEKTYGLSNDSE